ncbi:MAG: fluoride efflux transporter CrcB [Caulobacter sp.]|nr:fluoride efflux transporter CrcB [Caulobacter sp.]
MDKLLLVAAGGAAGSVARYLVGLQAARLLGPGWPYGTLTVNIVGGFLMGLLAATLVLRGGLDADRWRVLLGVGALGGFTTFSAFSLEVASMIERREWTSAFGYSLLSVAASVAALFAGLLLARKLLPA